VSGSQSRQLRISLRARRQGLVRGWTEPADAMTVLVWGRRLSRLLAVLSPLPSRRAETGCSASEFLLMLRIELAVFVLELEASGLLGFEWSHEPERNLAFGRGAPFGSFPAYFEAAGNVEGKSFRARR
jgi:hypothetical protein